MRQSEGLMAVLPSGNTVMDAVSFELSVQGLTQKIKIFKPNAGHAMLVSSISRIYKIQPTIMLIELKFSVVQSIGHECQLSGLGEDLNSPGDKLTKRLKLLVNDT